MSGESTYADWIAVDWGTSNLRAWAMRDDRPLAEAASDKGMGALEPDEFEEALLELIEPWLGSAMMPVIACGMVGLLVSAFSDRSSAALMAGIDDPFRAAL